MISKVTAYKSPDGHVHLGKCKPVKVYLTSDGKHFTKMAEASRHEFRISVQAYVNNNFPNAVMSGNALHEAITANFTAFASLIRNQAKSLSNARAKDAEAELIAKGK